MNLYKKGRKYEWAVKKDYEKRGYIVVRSSGSHSPYDLIAISEKETVGIQCKCVRNFGTADRKELENMKKILVPPNFRKEFRIKLDGKPEQVIPC